MTKPILPIVEAASVPERVGFSAFYPPEYAEQCRDRTWRELGNAVGLSQFGVNLTTLPPGAWSAHRHWHMQEDEFVYILDGEAVLVTDDGEHTLSAGMAAGFPAGKRNGHHLVNKSHRPVVFLEVGTRALNDDGEYPDIDMKFETRSGQFKTMRKNGNSF